jgi:hypothetical protein
MKKKYRIQYYVGTMWSFVTSADYYDEADRTSAESLADFAKQLAQTGIQHPDHNNEWIMPGAILKVTEMK